MMLRVAGSFKWSMAVKGLALAVVFLFVTVLIRHPERVGVPLRLSRETVARQGNGATPSTTEPAQCNTPHRKPVSHSAADIANRVFDSKGDASRRDTEIVLPLDVPEKNRQRIMGKIPFASVPRQECAAGAKDFCGVQISPTSLDESYEKTGPYLLRDGCRYRLLLIVIFNGDFYNNVDFIRSLYKEAFSKVVFYSQAGNKEHDVRASPKLWGGYKQHITVAQAMMEFPGYDGYWWIGDDVLLNFPYLFSSMDLEKVWTTRRELDKGRVFPAVNQSFADNAWVHWNTWYGMEAVQKLYRCFRPVYVQRMPAALSCSHCVVYMGSDVGYIPRRFVEEFLELSFVFRDVLHEISLPTILRLMVPKMKKDVFEDFDTFLYVWEGDRFPQIRQAWHVNTSFAHPLKFSEKVVGSRQFAEGKLAEARVKYQSEYSLRTGSQLA